MHIKELLTEDRAVSPVIGVILMVAITVILAAVIGTFVLGLGDRVSESAPQAQLSFTHDGTDAVITHEGGDAIDTSTITLSVAGSSVSNSNVDFSNVTNSWDAGEAIQDDGTASEGDDVRVIWNSPSSDKTATIGEGTAG